MPDDTNPDVAPPEPALVYLSDCDPGDESDGPAEPQAERPPLAA